MQWASDRVGDHKKNEPVQVAVDRLVHDSVAEPVPEDDLTSKLEMPVPPGGAVLGCLALEEVFPRQPVEVQAGEHHDDVVEVVLKGDEELGKNIVLHDTVVVGGPQVSEETVRDGEKGQVFDIRIVLRAVGDDMVNVVVALPPAQTQATDEVGNDDTDNTVDVEMVRNTHVPSVVGREDQLMPEGPKTEGAWYVPTPSQKQKHSAEEEGIAEALNGIGEVVTVIESFSLDALVEFTILSDDGILSLLIKRGVLVEIKPNLLPRQSVEMSHAIFGAVLDTLGTGLLILNRRDRGEGIGSAYT